MDAKAKKKYDKYIQGIQKDVKEILAEEANGEKDAFIDWLHAFYMSQDGDKLSDFDAFKESPLTLDMIDDWNNDCTSDADRVELIDHIFSHYRVEDFDEPEHFDKDGNVIFCYGKPDDKHFDKDGNPIAPVPIYKE